MQQEEWPAVTASVTVVNYTDGNYEGDIDVTLSRIADENTWNSGVIMRDAASRGYREAIAAGQPHTEVLAAILAAHEGDGTCYQIDPTNPNRREIRDFCINSYQDTKRREST